jgi:hypothetical protein
MDDLKNIMMYTPKKSLIILVGFMEPKTSSALLCSKPQKSEHKHTVIT